MPPKGTIPKSAFTKGDPRINRKGRPKNFDQLRKLAQAIAHSPVVDQEGNAIGTVATELMDQWSHSLEPRLQIEFVRIAFGKVPDEIRGTIQTVAMTIDDWNRLMDKNSQAALEMEQDFIDDEEEGVEEDD